MFMSQSFRMGYGGIEHNLRLTKTGSVRQCGLAERRHLNENIIIDDTLPKKDYVQQLIHKTVENLIGDRLIEYNEKQIRNKHPERVITIDDWLKNQQYTSGGKQKRIVSEYIVQIGDKFSGCPYEIETDNNGNMLDCNGKNILIWDKRKTPAYKDGKITESKISKKLKIIYKEFVEEFQKQNQRAIVISATVHNDEQGGSHLHINVIWKSKTKNGLGIGLGKTQAMKQQYEERGIKCKNTRKDNAENQFRLDSLALLERIALKHGIEKLDMGNKENHRTIPEFKRYANKMCEEIERRNNELDKRETEIEIKEMQLKNKENILNQKEKELNEREAVFNKDIAKNEWWTLYKLFPETYKKVHTMTKNNVNNHNKSLDKTSNVLYNNT